MTLLSVRGLCKSYSALEVTKDVSFDVAPGELHAIIGTNGAVKTTPIGQSSGQIAPASGPVVLDGRNVIGLGMAAQVHLGLARSFQITSILPRFTVLENVAPAVQARSGSSFRFVALVAAEAMLNDDGRATLAEAGLSQRAGFGPPPSPTASTGRSNWPSRWRRGPGCCCWTSPSPGSADRWPRPSCSASPPSRDVSPPC